MIQPTKTSPDGINLIKEFEGCKLDAYQDSVGVWTIGVGHTGPLFMDKMPIVAGLTITQQEANRQLEIDLGRVEAPLARALASLPFQVAQYEFDAMVSFAFNLGINALFGSTLWKLFSAQCIQQAADEFPKWNHAGGQVVEGLTRRREAERALFLTA